MSEQQIGRGAAPTSETASEMDFGKRRAEAFMASLPPDLAERVVLPPYFRTRSIRNIASAVRYQPDAAVQLCAA